ncbi:hypothetical protein E2I00_015180 [Balaenoptera physalus]|uniref:G-protein coupled receptors family 1 profile domain-containing protein n=1 Tax=Balaenoptera physalus TaxID=9770 RepID=A0A643BV94_BALPH|nr:hypothetical protein E2I00_015180 [Balaenoptera physalus]
MMSMENNTVVTEFILLGLPDAPEMQVPLFIIFTLFYLITLVGNLGMIMLILLDSHLHTLMYFSLSNLSLVDFGYSSAITPNVMAGFLTGNKVISYNACTAQMFFFTVFATVESYLLASMAYDRYAAVSNLVHHFFCDLPAVMVFSCSDKHISEMVLVYISTFHVFFALMAIFISCMFIFITILKMHSAEGFQRLCLPPAPVIPWTQTNSIFDLCSMVIPTLNPVVYSLRKKQGGQKCIREAVMVLSCSDKHMSEMVLVCISTFHVFFALMAIFISCMFIFITILKTHDHLHSHFTQNTPCFLITTENLVIHMENGTNVMDFIVVGLTNAPELQIPFFIVFILIFLISTFGNLGMITLILLDSHLHTPIFNVFFALLVILISYLFISITVLKRHSAKGYQKGLSTCASHLSAVSIFYGTVIFMYLQPSSNHSMDTDKVASVFYAMVIPMLNPIVYSLRNKEVKSAFKKVLGNAKFSLAFGF